LFVGDTSNWRGTMYVFRYSKLNNYFFVLKIIIVIDRSYQEYFDMFMILRAFVGQSRSFENMIDCIYNIARCNRCIILRTVTR